jgi:hypothetical protein
VPEYTPPPAYSVDAANTANTPIITEALWISGNSQQGGTVRLTWTLPSNYGSMARITKYFVKASATSNPSTDPSTQSVVDFIATDSTTKTLQFPAGKPYISLWAFSSSGFAISPAVTIKDNTVQVTSRVGITAPGSMNPARAGAFSTYQDKKVFLQFEGPADDGGSPILRFTVTSSDSTNSPITFLPSEIFLRYSVNNIPAYTALTDWPSTGQTVTVVATNAVGDSPPLRFTNY